MSAAAQAQSGQKSLPKVLRIGIIQEGKVAERLIRSGDTVSVGDSPRATFTFAGHGLGQAHNLFVPGGGSYVLVVPESVEGKISWKDGIRDLSDLRARGEMQKKGEFWTLQLGENIRGKIVLGENTLLFQFVNAPPEPVRAVSPADFRPRLFNDDDPLFLGLTGVFNGIAFLFYIAVMLAPPVEDNGMEAAKEFFSRPKEPEAEVITIKAPDQGNTEQKKPDTTKQADKKDNGAPKPKSAPSAESVTQKSLALQLFGTTGMGSDQQAADILGDQAAIAGRLDAAMNGVTGAEVASAGSLGLMSGSGGGGTGDIAVGIKNAEGGAAGTGTAAVVKVKKPKADAEAGDISADEGDAGSIVKVVKASKGRIETCVQQALNKDPTTSGRVAVGWSVAKGKVSDAHITSNSTKNDDLGQCVLRAVRSMRFDESFTGTVDEYAWVVSGVD